MLIWFAIISSLLFCVQAAGNPLEKFQCHTGAIDMVFVMDDSGSVTQPNFQLGLEAAVEFTQSLDIGVGDALSRVGFVTFSEKASMSFNLNNGWTNTQVESAIKHVVYSAGGGTEIAKGMDMAIKKVFEPNARQVPKIMIIITDGQDSSDVHAELSQANEQHIRTYAIGVGNDVDRKQLINATGDVNRVYIVSSYGDIATALSKICNEIETSVAPPTVEPPRSHNPRSCGCDTDDDFVNVWLDIIFVIDASDSISEQDFGNTKQLLMDLAGAYTIGSGPESAPHKYTRVGIVATADKAVRFAELTDYKSGEQMSSDVGKRLKKMGGTYKADLGMKYAADMLEEAEAAGTRMNVRKVVVLFSSTDIKCAVEEKSIRAVRPAGGPEQDTICQLVSQMKSDRVAIITVASKLADEEKYPDIDIADECDRITNDGEMVEKLIQRICIANCYCLYPYTQFVTQKGCESYGECVYVHGMALSYKSAEATCKRESETLTDILSMKKDEFLKDLHLDTGFFPYWVGAKYTGGVLKWDSGSESLANDWFHWGESQPDASKGECIVQKAKGLSTSWYSEKCGSLTPTHYFSCQKPSCSASNYCDFF